MRYSKSFVAIAALLLLPISTTASAEHHKSMEKTSSSPNQKSGASNSTSDQQVVLFNWREMRSESVSVRDLLRGDITNGLNEFGQISNVVLNKDGTAAEFVTYDTSSLFFATTPDQTGFLPFSEVDLNAGASPRVINASIDRDGSSVGADELEVTADEAEYRLVSRIVESRLEFANGEYHEIEDVLIHPETGKLMYFVVAKDAGTLFSLDRRAVPAEQVRFRDGEFRTNLTFSEVEDMQPYDTTLL